VRYGLEAVPADPGAPPIDLARVRESVLTLGGRRLGDVLDAIVREAPQYRWAEVGGTIVVRATPEGQGVLDRRIDRFAIGSPTGAFQQFGSAAQAPMVVENAPPAQRADPRYVTPSPAPIVLGPGKFSDALYVLLEKVPDYEITATEGLVGVAPTSFLKSRDYFMNQPIGTFAVKAVGLFRAIGELRHRLDPAFQPGDCSRSARRDRAPAWRADVDGDRAHHSSWYCAEPFARRLRRRGDQHERPLGQRSRRCRGAAGGSEVPRALRTLPDAADSECVEERFVGDNGQVFHLCLSDQHAVEGIAMRNLEAAGALSVVHRDRQIDEPLARETTRDVRRDIERAWQLAQPGLRGELPGRGRAHEDRVVLVGEGRASAPRQTPVAIQPPEQRVCVEEQPHRLFTPGVALDGGQRIEKAGSHPRAAAHRPKRPLRWRLIERHELRDRLRAACNDDGLASAGTRNEPGQLRLGCVNGVRLGHSGMLANMT
jgi:hypothetical protein